MTASLTFNQGTDPTGGNAAAKLTEGSSGPTGSARWSTEQDIVIPAGAQVTLAVSIHIGSSGTRNLALSLKNANDTNAAEAIFNPSTGAVVTSSLTGLAVINFTATTILTGGWFNVSLTATFPSSDTVGIRALFTLANGTAYSYSGDGASNVLLYNPTVTTPAPVTPPVGNLLSGGAGMTFAWGSTRWTTHATLTTNAGTDPTGGGAAAKLTEGTGSGFWLLEQDVDIQPGVSYDYSVSVKPGSGGAHRYFGLIIQAPAPTLANFLEVGFDPSNGNLVSSYTGGRAGIVNTTITAQTGGWYQILITVTFPVSDSRGMRALLVMDDKPTNDFYVGDGVSNLLLYNPQFVVHPTPAIPSVTAVPANDFLTSTGICTHIGQGVPEANYRSQFIYTGIRNCRDYTAAYLSYIALHDNTVVPGVYPGVKMDLITGLPTDIVTAAVALANAGALVSVEGNNEPNNFPFDYNGATGGGFGTWVPVAQYQRDLYSLVKANSTISSYPVLGTSECGAEIDNVGLQFLTIPAGAGTLMPDGTVYSDYANCHNYVIGNGCPIQGNMAWTAAAPFPLPCIDGLSGNYGMATWRNGFLGNVGPTFLNLPRATTETGWGTNSITEDQQGKIYLAMFLAQWKRGWRYTYIYQMHDNEGGDASFGIFHDDGTPKLSATYIHNLTTILQDLVSNAPGTLAYQIPNPPGTFHDLLLQKSDGTFWLAVWDENFPVLYQTPVDRVTVTFGSAHTINIYDPTIGTGIQQTLTSVSTVPLTLSGNPLILKIT